MKNQNRILTAALMAATLLTVALAAPPLCAQRISVRLLNMSDTTLGPVLVATHPSSQSPLLDPSEAPTEALRQLASGSEVMLEDETRALARRRPHVNFGVIQGPEPGQSTAAEIRVTSYHRNISLAAWLPGGGLVAMAPRRVSGQWGPQRVDLPAWEVGDTVLVHRSRPSPIARAWVQYERPVSPAAEGARERRAASASLTPAQQARRERCLAGSPTCVWRLEGDWSVCSDCIPPLRPNAARTHCIGD